MSKFIILFNDSMVNLDHVGSIVPTVVEGKTVYTFVMTDGSVIHGRTHEDLEELQASVIPAAPGFEAVQVHQPGESDEWIECHPVIGWRIYPDGLCLGPVTPDGDRCTAVLYPDGRVVEPAEGQWPSYAKYVASKRAGAKKARNPLTP